MLDLASLITHIQTGTGYVTEYAGAQAPSLANRGAAPEIFVMYHSLHPAPGGILGEGESPDPYMYFAEDLSQKFLTQLVCQVESFGSTTGAWWTLAQSIIGWIPYPAEKDFTGIYHCEGGAMGLENGRIWWQDIWRIDFPRASLLS